MGSEELRATVIYKVLWTRQLSWFQLNLANWHFEKRAPKSVSQVANGHHTTYIIDHKDDSVAVLPTFVRKTLCGFELTDIGNTWFVTDFWTDPCMQT